MKTIKQIADELSVSKQAIHQRMKREPLSTRLQGLTQNVDGVIYIDVDGENMIKSAFFKNEPSTPSTENVDTFTSTFTLPVDTVTTEYINSIKEQILALTADKKILQEQITDLQNDLRTEREHSRQQAEKLTELTRNSQILLKQEQEKTAFLLPEQPPTVSSEPDASGMKIKQRPFWQFWKK